MVKNKEKKSLTEKEVYDTFEKYGVFNYLREGYEILHTQGRDWLMNDIEEFLRIRIENKSR